jgi:hypothetical protein
LAKKSRRERKKARQKKRTPQRLPHGAPAPSPVGPLPEGARIPQGMALPSQRTVTDFREQYTYVYQDLKRIAILGGAMFAVLITLSLVLR